MNPPKFTYPLPKHLIAQSAVHPTDSCKLMILNKKNKHTIEHKLFKDIINYLKPGDVLVVNQTKVIPAKLLGKKSTGAKVEVILTKKIKEKTYECRIKGTNVKESAELMFKNSTAKVVTKVNDIYTIKFTKLSQSDLIIPTPPYIKKSVPEKDYQTSFAKINGSLAAPTAGLHFTPKLIKQLKSKGINFAPVTLHIGFGTFLPVRDIATYKTEPEYIEITKESADIINNAKRIIAVGTTSVKSLETAAKHGKIQPYSGYSDIFIKPGYVFKSNIAALITNFHLPKSSLLMLVCAFGVTKRILNAYNEAIKHSYRFYSLGDAMLVVNILPMTNPNNNNLLK